MRLGLNLGYWMAGPPTGIEDLLEAAEDCGFDAVFAAESWGSDAFTPLAWWGSATTRVRLGTAIAQMSARTPVAAAMQVMTLDHLSRGRVILGLGVSGPQVVEGWYGQPFARPLARTREYVDIIRQVLAREAPVVNDGAHYPLPYTGQGATGQGKSLKSILHPFRVDVPIWLGAEGPKNVALAAEIADGWLPIYFTPGMAPLYNEWLDEGFARPGARNTRETFEIAATCNVVVTESDAETAAARDAMRPFLALYIGGMGAKGQHFHQQLFARMGYADLAEQIGELFMSGKKDEATALVPDALIEELSIIGSPDQVRAGVKRWEDAGVTMLLVTRATVESIQRVAGVVLAQDQVPV